MSTKNTNTGAASVATTTKPTMRRYWRNLSALDMAVIKQLTGGDGVARNLSDGQCEIDEDTAEQLANVCRCSCGAAGGFSGFTYYSETREFFAAHRDEIAARILEQIDEGLFSDENGRPASVIGAVVRYESLKDEDPAEVEEMVARAFFGPLEDVKGGDLDTVANACAWGALEDLAFSLDGREIDDEEGGAE